MDDRAIWRLVIGRLVIDDWRIVLGKLRGVVQQIRMIKVLFILLAATAAYTQSSPGEQTHFSAEDTSVRPVPVPADVMRMLGKDEMVRNALENEEKIAPPQSWFSASEIHLSGGPRPDLVVEGNPPLAGANVTTFWVFRATERGHELVMMSPAHDLYVMKTRHKDYRDLELLSATAIENWTITLHFDGKKYVKFSEKMRRNDQMIGPLGNVSESIVEILSNPTLSPKNRR